VTGSRAPTAEEIARYAYRLFEERGRLHGHALDDWLAAERALVAEVERRLRRVGARARHRAAPESAAPPRAARGRG
jgi:hypothetical protein